MCAQCRRIVGYVDEKNIAHFDNVRLLRFGPINIRFIGGKWVQCIKTSDNVSAKRKYPVDIFDIIDEPLAKKPKVFQNIILMQVNVHNESGFSIPSDDEIPFWEQADFVTSTPGYNSSFVSPTPSGSESGSNELETASEDEPILDPRSLCVPTYSFDLPSYDSAWNSPFSINNFQNHPNFRGVCRQLVYGECVHIIVYLLTKALVQFIYYVIFFFFVFYLFIFYR